MERLRKGAKAVGAKQTRRIVREGGASVCFLALDAEDRVTEPLRTLCREHGVPVTDVATMSQLGTACGIDIGTSAAVLLDR